MRRTSIYEVTQAATIARLERELAEARQENSQMARMLAEPSEVKADAEALRALAAWINADKGWRKVSDICTGERFAFEVTIRFWRGAGGQEQVWGEADTLAAAIMDALSKARA